MDNRLEQIGNEIVSLEQRHEQITSEEFLSQFSGETRDGYVQEAQDISNEMDRLVVEARNAVESYINDSVVQMSTIVNLFKSTRVDSFIEEVGGKDAAIPEILAVLESELDVEKFNELTDIYNKMNGARNQAASAISRARAISVPNITIPPIAQIIQKAIAKILADIKGGLEVATSEFSKIREDWPGPKKIRGTLSEKYGGIVKG